MLETSKTQSGTFKGLLHHKIIIVSLVTYPISFQTRKSFVHLRKTIEDILEENRETCDPLTAK